MKATAYVKGKRIVVGEIRNGYFLKKVRKSKHLFRKFDAWGFDYRVLVDTILPNCEGIFIWDVEDSIWYYVPTSKLGHINESGKYIQSSEVYIRHFNSREDEGVQIFLPRRYWYKFNKSDGDSRISR